MHLYSGSSIDFISDSTNNRIASKLEDNFFTHFRYKAPQSEVRSWQNSLRAMSSVLQTAALTDHGVIVEYQLPQTSRRLDCMVTGKDTAGKPNAVVVELKQWDEIEISPIEDCVLTFLGGRKRDVLHPSRQVGNYQRYLLDVHTAFNTNEVSLNACGYAHNLKQKNAGDLFDDCYSDLLRQWPVFPGDRADDLATYLDGNLGGGSGGDVLETVVNGTFRPHKRLLEHTASVIRNEPCFVLLDEQQVVFNHVLAQVRARQLSTEQTIFLIHGGPGTGKSVIAVNLLAELSAQGYVALHATGSKAFTENLRKTVGARAAAQFGYFNNYVKTDAQSLDALICDEAHRIRDVSWNRFTKRDDRSDKPQINEIIAASKVPIFFIDDMQVVRPGEVGSSELIRTTAAAMGIELVEHTLEAQFRCNGSDGYIQWVENTLDLAKTPTVLWHSDDAFDFDVVDSPEELEALIRMRHEEGSTARLAAGFCWSWSNPNNDGSLVNDVVVGDWTMPWNAKDGSARLAPDIPKSNYWASDPNGVNQVGCVYTAQGFEYDYAGVIFGRDLVYRPREGWVGQREFSKDTVVRKEKNNDQFTELVKHTYRVLMTRGLRGCYVYFEDEQTRDFVLSRIER